MVMRAHVHGHGPVEGGEGKVGAGLEDAMLRKCAFQDAGGEGLQRVRIGLVGGNVEVGPARALDGVAEPALGHAAVLPPALQPQRRAVRAAA